MLALEKFEIDKNNGKQNIHNGMDSSSPLTAKQQVRRQCARMVVVTQPFKK